MLHDVPVGSIDELPLGGRKLAFAGGRSIVLFNIDGTVHAIENSCPHNGASLASGRLDGRIIHCPAHGLRFDVTTGCMPGAGGLCLTKLPVDVRDGRLVVTVNDTAAPGTPPA
ncbi:Rieske (2Fe-2S) protein [Variovorax humicola]|uniref:Rieske (2Fe-2S) protein n=1 Tax=Variovorax humicola TaxID=1769758 RepID=A0ABU8W710_9BURK